MVEILKDRHPFLDWVRVGFILTDAHSKILYANRYTERLFGYSRGEMEGERIRILFLEEDLVSFVPNVIYLALYESGFDGEALLRRKNGTRVFAHLYTTTFKEEGEVFLSFCFQEIQRLKMLEKERSEMERRAGLGMMLEGISHQIRNPVAAIGGYAQRLVGRSTASPKGKSYLLQILHETKRLETMIQRLEEYVLIPKPTFRKEKIEEVVEAVLQTFSKKVTEKGVAINLETRALEGEGDCFMDRGLIAKALSNVLENSLEAVRPRPMRKKTERVRVSLFGNGGTVGVSVSDKGEGIPKKNIDRVFEPFFSTRPDRVGLGLTFVKRVVEEQGGSIRVESRLKKGTTVTFILPKDRRRIVRRGEIFSEAVRKNTGGPFPD